MQKEIPFVKEWIQLEIPFSKWIAWNIEENHTLKKTLETNLTAGEKQEVVAALEVNKQRPA